MLDEKFSNEFCEAVHHLCDKLEIDHADVKIECFPNGRILEYRADSKSQDGLAVGINHDPDNIEDLQAFISIPLENAFPFIRETNIPKYGSNKNRLIHWIDTILYEKDLEYKLTNLNTLFHNTTIRIYENKYPRLTELQIFLAGIQETFPDGKLIIYRFQHINELDNYYRWFSYAFSIKHDRCESFYTLFPKIGGLDSGGAKLILNEIETMIKNMNMLTTRKEFNVGYNELEQFLKQKTFSFHSPEISEVNFYPYAPADDSFGNEFYSEYTKFLKTYRDGDYPRALRDLRTLVEKALRITRSEFNIDPEKESKSIVDLCNELLSQNIPKYLRTWVESFTAIANYSVHGRTILNDQKQEQMIILLGMEIINELEKSFYCVDI